MGVLELLKSRALLIPLGIGIVMQLSQQLSGTQFALYKIQWSVDQLNLSSWLIVNLGINAVLYYSTELFIGAGLGRESAKYATIGSLLILSYYTKYCIRIRTDCK